MCRTIEAGRFAVKREPCRLDEILHEGIELSLRYDPRNPGGCRLSLRIPVRRLAVDEPWLRRRVGFSKSLDEEDREEIRDSMLDENQLDAERYPYLFVKGRSCARIEGDPNRVAVQLTVRVRGRTKRLATILNFSPQHDRLEVQGSFRVRHADFGIEPYSAFFGVVANAEPIEFVGHFSWVRR